jgi:hypothetical protein
MSEHQLYWIWRNYYWSCLIEWRQKINYAKIYNFLIQHKEFESLLAVNANDLRSFDSHISMLLFSLSLSVFVTPPPNGSKYQYLSRLFIAQGHESQRHKARERKCHGRGGWGSSRAGCSSLKGRVKYRSRRTGWQDPGEYNFVVVALWLGLGTDPTCF